MCGPLHLKKGQISILGGDVIFHIPFRKFPSVQSVTVSWNGPFLLKHLSFSDRPHSVWVPCPPHAALCLTFWYLENAGGFGVSAGSLWDQVTCSLGLPRWLSCKESACQCRRCRRLGSIPGLGRPPGEEKWQPTPVFLPGESHGPRNLEGYSL